MRTIVTSLILVSAGFLRVCGSDSSSNQPSASAEVAASAAVEANTGAVAKPRIGGYVLSVGQHSVELLAHQSGAVEALVSDSSGKLVSDGVGLTLRATSKAQGAQEIALAFTPPLARFEGQAKAGVELTPGPTSVTLSLGGKLAQGSVDRLPVVAAPEFGGSVLLVGDYSAEVIARADGEVLAFVKDPQGAALSSAGGLGLTANVQTSGSARESVELAFDAARKCFAGHVKAGVEIAPGALELSLRNQGRVLVGSLERVSLRMNATHGGQVLVAGEYSLEVVPEGKLVHVYAFDAAGKALAKADASLRLQLGLSSPRTVALDWDAASSSFTAALGADVNLRAQPIRLLLSVDGHSFEAAASSLDKVASLRLDPGKLSANGKVDVAADAAAKLGADAKVGADAKIKVPDVKANLAAGAAKAANASAELKVVPPKINVTKSANASASTGTSAGSGAKAKASAGFSFGVK
jgi:hypothetical protein